MRNENPKKSTMCSTALRECRGFFSSLLRNFHSKDSNHTAVCKTIAE